MGRTDSNLRRQSSSFRRDPAQVFISHVNATISRFQKDLDKEYFLKNIDIQEIEKRIRILDHQRNEIDNYDLAENQHATLEHNLKVEIACQSAYLKAEQTRLSCWCKLNNLARLAFTAWAGTYGIATALWGDFVLFGFNQLDHLQTDVLDSKRKSIYVLEAASSGVVLFSAMREIYKYGIAKPKDLTATTLGQHPPQKLRDDYIKPWLETFNHPQTTFENLNLDDLELYINEYQKDRCHIVTSSQKWIEQRFFCCKRSSYSGQLLTPLMANSHSPTDVEDPHDESYKLEVDSTNASPMLNRHRSNSTN